MDKVIGIIAGSLRKASFSKKIAEALPSMAPQGFDFTIISIDDLPVYNQDFDDHNEVPEQYTVFRNDIQSLDGVIFVTPEYNRSVPSVLKNAIDVGSRPKGKNVWAGKPTAVFSNSPGNIGAFGANHHLRQSLVYLDAPAMAQPEVYISNVEQHLDGNGNIKDQNTKDFLQKAIDAYIVWLNKIVKGH